jgi:hypothetical protein
VHKTNSQVSKDSLVRGRAAAGIRAAEGEVQERTQLPGHHPDTAGHHCPGSDIADPDIAAADTAAIPAAVPEQDTLAPVARVLDIAAAAVLVVDTAADFAPDNQGQAEPGPNKPGHLLELEPHSR